MTGRRIGAVWAQLTGLGARLWRDRTARYVIVIILVLGALGSNLPFEPYDWLQKSVTARLNAKPYTGDAIIIEIDNQTFEGLGRPALDDRDLARLVRNLDAAKASRIVLGRIRQRSASQRSSPELLEALDAASPKVVLFTELVPKKSSAFSWATFRPANGQAYFHDPGIDPPTARRVQLASEISSTTPFGAPWALPPTVRLGAQDYPSIAQIMVGQPQPIFDKYDVALQVDPGSIPTLNAIDVISGRFDPAAIRGKQALIYSSSDVTRDAIVTPFGRLPSAAPITVMAAETLRNGPPLMLGWIPAFVVAVLGIVGWMTLRSPLLRRGAFALAFVCVVASPLVLERLLIFQATSNAVFLMILVALGRQWSKFRATLALARSAAETKSWFLAQASHDLRQPIHAIGMLAARLGQTDLNPAQADLARKIDRSIEAANRMLQSLLDLATIESGSLSPQPAPISVNALLAELDEQAGPLAERAGVELRFVPCEATIMADRTLTLAMLQNIVANSIKYATGKRVLVGARRTGKTIALCVHDVGQGISDSDMRHVRKA
ncbi:MAG TPA: CHASE2 domain-containing protein, partial [Novosphingobium sp.]|nr:CHASE2 domain-containing protein [Novosphingobium sp.]